MSSQCNNSPAQSGHGEARVRYEPPVPVWMPGKEALDFIRGAADADADAIDQLRAAIVKRAVGARLIGMKPTPMGSSPISVPSASIPHPDMWRQADIRLNGSVRFDRKGPWQPFEVIRENVLRNWSSQPAPHSDRPQDVKARPIDRGIREAISELWPDGIPSLTAKDRDQKILEWLKARGYSIPQGKGLPRAVQRAMKPPA
jgi:hypothetical protein